MDDEYILMHGGTEEDIAQIAHDRGACNYAVNGSYCEICKKGKKDNEKDLLLKELDILKTYFEEAIDGASEDKEVDLGTMQMLFNLKGYVEDAIKYVKGDKN